MLYAKFIRYGGYDCEIESEKKHLEIGKVYEVECVRMGQSHTSIYLIGKRIPFNSVCFRFYKLIDDQMVEHDIYRDKEYNPYLRR